MKRVLSFVVVMLLALSTVLAGNTIDANAAAGKVKSIKVTNAKKKKVSIVKGKTKTLKVKVTVTGKASKKYTFKSSKKSVVTAKKSGKNIKLTAKKPGTAKITIKSKANKKKKVVIKVTVTNPPAKVPDTPVTPVVEPETHVAARDYILEERIVPLKKGTKMKDLYIPFQVENDFTVTKVSNTPKGLKGEKINDKYLLNGTPTETGVFKFAVTVKDKVTGEKNTTNVTFVIGSDDEVQAYCPVISGYYCVDGYNTVKQCTPQEMIVVGGSGNFKVSAVGGNYNMFDIEEGDEESYYVTYVVTGIFDYVGEFASSAKIQDIVNGEVYACDLKLNITQGERISGRVTDMAGKGVEGLDVVARSTTFYSTVFTDTTDANGTYIVYVAKDSYSINVQSYDLSLAEVEAASINKATTLNFKVQGYTVNLVPSNSKIDLSSAHGHSEASYSKFYGTGSKLFMPAGTYNIY